MTLAASHDRLDRIAREVCAAIGSRNGHRTVYAALMEVATPQHTTPTPEALVDIARRLDALADHHTLAGDDYTAKLVADLARDVRRLTGPQTPASLPGTVFTGSHGKRQAGKGKKK